MTILPLLSAVTLAAAPIQGTPDAGICAAEERQIAELDGALATCRVGAKALEGRLTESDADRVATEVKLTACTLATQACQAAHDSLCVSTDQLARAVVQNSALPPTAAACMTPDHQARLSELASGWARLGPALGSLESYASGLTDGPRGDLHLGLTAPERTLARLFGTGQRPSPVHRRLLVEALRRVAPRFWRYLRSSGTPVVDGWLAGTSRLNDALVKEVRHGVAREGLGSAAGPPLAAALKYVQTYFDLAGCAQMPARAPECARARQLQELFESSGPLVVRRREQLIWSTDCQALTPAVVLEWVEELPTPQANLRRGDWDEVLDAAFAKLHTCFLADRSGGPSFRAWMEQRLPRPDHLSAIAFTRIDQIGRRFDDVGPLERCGRAFRALEAMPSPTTCQVPSGVEEVLAQWLPEQSRLAPDTVALPLRTCAELVRLRWGGQQGFVPSSFVEPPGASELVRVADTPSAMARLRLLCAERSGSLEQFPNELRRAAALAAAAREPLDRDPWRADPVTAFPIEQLRYARSAGLKASLSDFAARRGPCETLGVSAARCEACAQAGASGHYDCALLRSLAETRASRRHRLEGLVAVLTATLLGSVWAARVGSNWKRFGGFVRATRAALSQLGLRPHRDPWCFLSPSRFQIVTAWLPRDPAWTRWGERVAVVRAGDARALRERDIHLAAGAARSIHAELALLVHDEGVEPDLGAVRALLDWAARGRNAIQVVPVIANRLLWARSADDLLDLIEQTSLRGNPFDVRGRITSSSQFFNRERLVSGLLASAQAGQWTVVTGLRRFGKSSLALEVARRLPGPSAYVDLAGFHHEIAIAGDPASAAETILAYLCLRLHEAAAERWPQTPLPALPLASGLDGSRLAAWFSELDAACSARSAGAPMLLVFDELEQAIGVGPQRLSHALDVLAILVGRLRAALDEPLRPRGGPRAGVLLCGALHPLLWAPLATLGNQSLVGAFPNVCVPTLSDEAAAAMMRALGARQGIRFSDVALRTIIAQSQGVPLLARRLGASVLELYDPERARQGGLGAVDVGAEGAAAAVTREEEDGAPLRVWVESEIGDPTAPTGRLLRIVAREGRCSAEALRKVASDLMAEQFDVQGLGRVLDAAEKSRRAGEAAAHMVRMLAATGLLVAEGDIARPEAYVFPDGLVRRILASRNGASPFDG